MLEEDGPCDKAAWSAVFAPWQAVYARLPAQIAKRYGMTATQMALAWCNTRWFVDATIIGATSM